MAWAEKDFEEKMTSHIDQIYKNIFGSNLVNIERIDRNKYYKDDRAAVMDSDLSIDTHLTFSNGMVLTVQEKTLRFINSRYNQFTFEYYNNPKTKDPGEWFKMAAQLYFFGYANQDETGYLRYWVVDVLRLRLLLNDNFTLEQLENRFLRQNTISKANFFAIPFNILENDNGVVLYKS